MCDSKATCVLTTVGGVDGQVKIGMGRAEGKTKCLLSKCSWAWLQRNQSYPMLSGRVVVVIHKRRSVKVRLDREKWQCACVCE
jgi:hypothetical protein